jgi:hypothetical protein
MTRFLPTVGLLALVSILLTVTGCGDRSKDNPPPAANNAEGASKTKQIMIKMNGGKTPLLPKVGKELDSGDPPWNTLDGEVKELVQLSNDLGQSDPPKGSKESWQQQTKTLTDNAAELERAVQARDRDRAKAAQKKMAAPDSCQPCHREHRP